MNILGFNVSETEYQKITKNFREENAKHILQRNKEGRIMRSKSEVNNQSLISDNNEYWKSI